MNASIRENCLKQVRAAIPEAMALVEGAGGELSLAECARAMPGRGAALQDGEDLIALAESEAARLFCPATGAALRRELENRFLALTANHHGVDFHPEFLQGDFIFALGCRDAVPLFTCGGVPCDNVSFPRGILLAPRTPDTTRPFHLPLLSNAGRRAFVSARGPYDPAQIKAALAALPRTPLSPAERRMVEGLAARIYLNPLVLKQESFREQMSVANALMWQDLSAPGFRLPPLTCLDFQGLAKDLIVKDLKKTGTLAYDLLLEREFTEAVFHILNDSRACWTVHDDKLERGSFLFWAIDENRRGVRLTLLPTEHALAAPERPDMHFPLTAQTLIAALEEERLLPSLYLSFAVLATARGLSCAGGVSTCASLPRMAEGTAQALRRCGESARADRLAVSSPLCTGALPLRARFSLAHEQENVDCAAGAMEILISGGITDLEWAELAETVFRDAFLCALPYHYEDLIPPNERSAGWMAALTRPAPVLLREEASARQ